MEQTNYTADYFLTKFSAIPERLWCEFSRSVGEQRCALGWCYPEKIMAKLSQTAGAYPVSDEEKALIVLVKILNPKFGAGGINNGLYKEYPQKTPKQRILAALHDIKKMQEQQQPPSPIPPSKPEPRVIHHYVAVSEFVKGEIKANAVESLN